MQLTTSFAGEYKMIVHSETGAIIKETEWFDNLITNRGLDLIAAGNSYLSFSTCVVGTGTTTPSVLDTQLVNATLSTTTQQSGSNTWYSSPTYYHQTLMTYRFAAVPAGISYNLSEVGIGSTATSLLSRALILDGSGNPITLSLSEGEVLDVIYKFRQYPSLVDADYEQTININGTDHTFSWRPLGLGVSGYFNLFRYSNGRYQYLTPYSGVYAVRTATSPTGTAGTQVSNTSPSQYIIGSYERNARFTIGLTNSNFAGGIKSFKYTMGEYDYSATYQCNVSPAIMKTSTQILTVDGKFIFARY